MAELLVVGFKGNIHRASGVLDELRVLDDKWILDLADALAVHRDLNGSVQMDQSYQPTGRRASDWGGVLGLLLGTSLSILRLVGATPTVAEGIRTAAELSPKGLAGMDHSYSRAMFDIPEIFFDSARHLVLPGDSAIYAILEAAGSALASASFQRYGGAILHQPLDKHQVKTLQRVLVDRAHYR